MFGMTAAVLGWIFAALFAALLLAAARRYFHAALKQPAPKPAQGPWRSAARVCAEVSAAYLLSRALIALVLAFWYVRENGELAGFAGRLLWLMRRWDGGTYIKLIERYYVNTGDDRLAIVFLPLYPTLARGLWWIGMTPLAAGMTVSNAALLASGCAIWRLGALTDGDRVGRRAMWLLMFCPVGWFFSAAFSESLFLLLTLLAALQARRRRFAWAVCFGALAANTRVLGMAVAVPIFFEMLRAERERSGRVTPAAFAACVLRVLPVGLGLAAYLGLNWKLFGDALIFLRFQRENWQQSLGTLANTFRYTLINAVYYSRTGYRMGTWWPQLAAMIGVPALTLIRRKRHPADETAYALVYHAVAFSPTWLLSGVRYAAGMYPAYLMGARLADSRRAFACLLLAEAALAVYLVSVGLWQGFTL